MNNLHDPSNYSVRNIAGGDGAGVLLAHKEGNWSDPVAVHLVKMGAGATFGLANRDTVVVLNHFAMKRLLEGKEKVSLGEDIGAAAGPLGASAASAMAVSEKAGGATAFIYTYQNGVLLNIEAVAAWIEVMDKANEKFYGTSRVDDIVEGKASAPDGSGVPALKEKIQKFVSEK
jgi:lipid-binding SYLF domain-containing protein